MGDIAEVRHINEGHVRHVAKTRRLLRLQYVEQNGPFVIPRSLTVRPYQLRYGSACLCIPALGKQIPYTHIVEVKS